MPKARSLADKLAKVRSLRGTATTAAGLKELRAALGDNSNLVVAEAAEIAGAALIADVTTELVAAFDYFMEDGEKRDKICRAKTAIAETLNKLDYSDEDFWWRGARYVQHEPVWGSSQDTAATLRVTCAFALVRNRAHGVQKYLVDLLTDSEKAARAGAAQALAYSETEAAGLLLRLKARLGDEEPEVISECFNGIIRLTPDDGVAFVAEFLDTAAVAIQEAAILALGDSRRQDALEVLKSYWDRNTNARLEETILMALALLRLPAAFDFLLGLVQEGKMPRAGAALAALALHRYDDKLREKVAAAVATSGREALQGQFEKRFRA